MDARKRRISEATSKSTDPPEKRTENLDPDLSFNQFDLENLSFGADAVQTFPGFATSMDSPSLLSQPMNQVVKNGNQMDTTIVGNNGCPDWDPRKMLSNLSFLEQKIHQVQDIVCSITKQEDGFSVAPNELAAQQQLVTADLTCIIIQLISTAGSLLPSMKNNLLTTNHLAGQLESIIGSSGGLGLNTNNLQQNEALPAERIKPSKKEDHPGMPNGTVFEAVEPIPAEEHDVKDCEDGVECENLPPGSYEVLQLEKEEILAPHTHFCLICGKGFKRDANLRMHMRGHGDEYKTPAALAKPSKEANSEPVLIKRYSCPFVGCKRNKEHKKFQPLKTILCVKNHYKRSHCDKSYTCSRCNSKKFSVMADLKTHEKHCGRDKWLCSCGTTFSRKDKLFGHVALFQGHTPALPLDESKASVTATQFQNENLATNAGGLGFDVGCSSPGDIDFLDVKGIDDDPSLFSSMNFDCCNFGGFHEFPREAFEAPEDSFPLMEAMPNNYIQEAGANSSPNLGLTKS